mmetsp:Transcript_7559/g.21444  ORF Transcript_7559/g.21444 Transcript_7559/m.21444 type:complete len:648 (+) Transcript_7559:194-2137(+)
MAFSKPRDAGPTPHLFIGNAGPQVGDTEESLRQLLGQWGEVVALAFPEGRSHVFASFSSEDQAAAAMEALHGTAAAQSGRHRVVKYADMKVDKAPAQLPVCTSAEQTGVPGLFLFHDFITAEEEQMLLDNVDKESWETLARRRVLHYGYVFHYVTRNIDPGQYLGPLPDYLVEVKTRVEVLPCVGMEIDQATVNEYPAGVGLSAHIDTHSAFTGPIVSLSLAGDTVMELRREEARRQLWLPRRSLLVMSGEARLAWAHYIPHRKSDNVNKKIIPRAERRVSFTFRKARGFPCDCDHPAHCDSQGSQLPPTRMALKLGDTIDGSAALPEVLPTGGGGVEETLAVQGPVAGTANASSSQGPTGNAVLEALEATHVHQVYDAIAPHFSSTRVAVWPEVRRFIDRLEPGSLLVDAGCGNGKYFGVRRDIAVIASDRSEGLVSQARMRIALGKESNRSVRSVDLGAERCSPGADVCVADAMELPLRTGGCDAVVCIAVLHHISSPERRVRMLAELLRVVRPGGRVLVTVWAQEQENAKKLAKWELMAAPPSQGSAEEPQDGGDYFVPWHLPFHRTEAAAVLSSMQTKTAAAQISEGSGGEINHEKGSIMFKRYYHLFREGELSRLAAKLEGCAVESEFFDASNWCVIIRKVK